MAEHQLELANLPPDLSDLIAAWPTIGPEIRGLLRALFQALGRSERTPVSRDDRESMP
jgi:hypothetical protein